MPFALITGAGKGIGRALAENLAAQKYDLLLVSRSEDDLRKVSDDLKARFHVQCNYLSADLSQKDSPKKIIEWINEHHFEISILINNAGYGLWGKFEELSLEELNEMLTVNDSAIVNLTHLLIPYLRKQSKAYILNVASSAAYQAMPTFAAYAASKAFVVLFTRALHHEMKGTNISVTCLTPGSVKTNFVNRARMVHMQALSDRVSDEPGFVAKAALRGMFAGKTEVMPGFMNRLGVFMNRLVPKSIPEKLVWKIYEKKEK